MVFEIVVGVEDSGPSERALDRALLEAVTTGRPLRALHVPVPAAPWGGADGFGYEDVLAAGATRRDGQRLAEDLLARAMSRRGPEGTVTAHAEISAGQPSRRLVAASVEAGLVVVGGRGHGEFVSAVVGSATAYVLHHAQCPVMVVPGGTSPVEPFHRVVVGLDGSASARSALLWGLDAARRAGCPLLAVYSWQSTTVPGRPPMRLAPTLPEYAAAARTWLDQALGEALPQGHGVDVSAQVLHRTPAWGCLQASREQDLLVVGSRGRGGFASLVLGSVATQCAQHAVGAVVVVRAGQQRLDTALAAAAGQHAGPG